MNGKKLLKLAAVIFVLEIILLVSLGGLSPDAENEGEVFLTVGPVNFMKFDMGLADFQNVPQWNFDGTPEDESTFWGVNKATTTMMILIDIFIILMAFSATRNLKRIPGRIQNVFEIIVGLFADLVEQALGEHGKRHIPMLGSLFLFLWISNIVGSIPLASEPTKDLNVPIGHMLVVLFVVHYESIRVRGLKKYLKSYNEPFFIMMPLNVIGEIAKGVSLSFRLFGNILGGAIIVTVISYLVKYTIMPVGLNLFFGLFVGTIQAFVFTMLGMTYIAVAISD
ncbi:F0F1 ATP synthase subunit A [Candidatus Latescibacterota bacterium]